MANAKTADKSPGVSKSSASIRSVVKPLALQTAKSCDCATKDDHAKPIGHVVQTGQRIESSVVEFTCTAAASDDVKEDELLGKYFLSSDRVMSVKRKMSPNGNDGLPNHDLKCFGSMSWSK